MHRKLFRFASTFLSAAFLAGFAAAQAQYDPGASDTEIKIGHTGPYSGPASAYGVLGETISAYFEMVNAAGGINGRKVNFISYDDGYNPSRTVEQIRRLVENDEVLFIFQSLGSSHNLAIRPYLNDAGIPHLFIGTGATLFSDPENYPWTMPWNMSYQTETRIYARYVIDNVPDAKIGVLYQNDDFGKDLLQHLREALGGKAEIASEQAYDVTDATVESQMASLKASGANVFFSFTTPRFAAQAIAGMTQLDWHPLHILTSVAASAAVLVAAGEGSVGTLTAVAFKDPTTSDWKDDTDYREWLAFMDRWYPGGDRNSSFVIYAYTVANVMTEVLRRCGDNLTRANVLEQARSIEDLEVPMFLPGIRVSTSATDYRPVDQGVMQRFDGQSWVPISGVIDAAGVLAN